MNKRKSKLIQLFFFQFIFLFSVFESFGVESTIIFKDTIIKNNRIIIGINDTMEINSDAVIIDESKKEQYVMLFIKILQQNGIEKITFIPIITNNFSLENVYILSDTVLICTDIADLGNNTFAICIRSFEGIFLYTFKNLEDKIILFDIINGDIKKYIYAENYFIFYKNYLISLFSNRYLRSYNAHVYLMKKNHYKFKGKRKIPSIYYDDPLEMNFDRIRLICLKYI